ncbi:MAG: hypothetical protein HY708_05315 [Ignavibacteriae bacterium]|nr:hypothetical protein [Ignavibacteriota bacterium]
MRLSFRDLNEAASNPAAFRRRIAAPPAVPQIRYSYYNVLVNTIYHFHKCSQDIVDAQDYMAEHLDSFKSDQKKDRIRDQFRWYVTDYFAKNLNTFEFRQNIRIIPDAPLTHELTISGQIGRIDLAQIGYVAWIFRSQGERNWIGELAMPLIQYELSARVFCVPVTEVSVGMYSFEEQAVSQHCYSNLDIQQARMSLTQLLRTLGLA